MKKVTYCSFDSIKHTVLSDDILKSVLKSQLSEVKLLKVMFKPFLFFEVGTKMIKFGGMTAEEKILLMTLSIITVIGFEFSR